MGKALLNELDLEEIIFGSEKPKSDVDNAWADSYRDSKKRLKYKGVSYKSIDEIEEKLELKCGALRHAHMIWGTDETKDFEYFVEYEVGLEKARSDAYKRSTEAQQMKKRETLNTQMRLSEIGNDGRKKILDDIKKSKETIEQLEDFNLDSLEKNTIAAKCKNLNELMDDCNKVKLAYEGLCEKSNELNATALKNIINKISSSIKLIAKQRGLHENTVYKLCSIPEKDRIKRVKDAATLASLAINIKEADIDIDGKDITKYSLYGTLKSKLDDKDSKLSKMIDTIREIEPNYNLTIGNQIDYGILNQAILNLRQKYAVVSYYNSIDKKYIGNRFVLDRSKLLTKNLKDTLQKIKELKNRYDRDSIEVNTVNKLYFIDYEVYRKNNPRLYDIIKRDTLAEVVQDTETGDKKLVCGNLTLGKLFDNLDKHLDVTKSNLITRLKRNPTKSVGTVIGKVVYLPMSHAKKRLPKLNDEELALYTLAYYYKK